MTLLDLIADLMDDPDCSLAARQVIHKAIEEASLTCDSEWSVASLTSILQQINVTEQEIAKASIVGNNESAEANAAAIIRLSLTNLRNM